MLFTLYLCARAPTRLIEWLSRSVVNGGRKTDPLSTSEN